MLILKCLIKSVFLKKNSSEYVSCVKFPRLAMLQIKFVEGGKLAISAPNKEELILEEDDLENPNGKVFFLK